MHRHRLDGVDFLGDPHRAQLGGGAGADGGGQRDTGDDRSDDADIEERRQESRQRLDADVAQRLVALHRDHTAGGQRQKRGDADRAADEHECACTHGHFGDQPDRLFPVAGERIRDVTHRLAVEQGLLAESVDRAAEPGEEAAEAQVAS